MMRKHGNSWLGGLGAMLLGGVALAHPVGSPVITAPLTTASNFSAMARQLSAKTLPFSQAVLMADTGIAWRIDLDPLAPHRAEPEPQLLQGHGLWPQEDAQFAYTSDLNLEQATLSSSDLDGASKLMGLEPLNFDLSSDFYAELIVPIDSLDDTEKNLNASGKTRKNAKRLPDDFDAAPVAPEPPSLLHETLPWMLGLGLILATIWGAQIYVRVSTRRRWAAPKVRSRRRRKHRSSDDFPTTVPMDSRLHSANTDAERSSSGSRSGPRSGSRSTSGSSSRRSHRTRL